MMSSIQFKSRASSRKVWCAALTAAFCFCLLSQTGFAQQESGSPPAAISASQWVIGPATANLGNAAQITVPEGCRFTDENFARVVLASSKEPIPNNLIGLLYPDSRQWFAILQYTEIGHVKVGDKEILDADSILKKYQSDIARQNKDRSAAGAHPVVADLSWALKPSYDPVLNKLEYALEARGAGGGSINYVVNLLGRRGVLSVTIVQPDQSGFNLTSMRDAMKGITYKNGERYSDYQPEDRVFRSGLAELILNSNGAEPLSRWERLAQNKWLWAGAVVILLLGGYGLKVLIIKRLKARYYRMDEKFHRAPAAQQPVATNGHAINGNGQPQVELANGQAALRPNMGFQRNGHRRRKKRFSYHAFYSDMVMNLTRCNYVGSPGGFLHGQSANLDGSTPSQQDIVPSSSMPDTANLLVAETSKLIQSQQKLIEGQRKLIEEQSKLIQEKSMLLDAENRALGKQSEALAEQQLM
jgi:uncharacterized membrane-anchored protein